MATQSDVEQAKRSVWQEAGFRAYLGASGCAGIAFAMQNLLASWLLIGVLLLPADQVGVALAIIGIPGIFVMLWGGASADRSDPKDLLLRVYLIAPILPLFLIVANGLNALNIWTVTAWGLGVSTLISFSGPALLTTLNRVSGERVQQGVTAATAVGFIVQMMGLAMAGQMERIGLSAALSIQAVCFLIGVLMVRNLPSFPNGKAQVHHSAWNEVLEGLKATYRNRDVFNVLLINFTSSIFNAGAFLTVFPFIIKRIFDGDAWLLAVMMIIFYAGATTSNLLMLRFMPLANPGRIFLVMQLSRMAILFLLWAWPNWIVLILTTIAWGLNMGITSTLARAIVQESAEPQYRGRIMSVFNLGFVGSAPIGALVLGVIIEMFGTLNALIPALAVSFVLFIYGTFTTSLWTYRSPAAKPG